ncbi:MAG: YsnF/AvaK domain-containing protein [Promicromonosporaceae bacterium]|nr:YsnF/AvaK domain-containing protein [Promicromonosporaceae bacterium]
MTELEGVEGLEVEEAVPVEPVAVDEVVVAEVAEPVTIPVDHPGYQTLKLLAEELNVSKRTVDTGVVRVERKTTTHTEPVDLELRRTSAAVDRVAINQPVDTIPTIRTEGDVVIVPVVEEQVEVTRRLILKEEVHIRLDESTERYHDDVEVRKQDVEVSQIPSETPDNGKVLS